MEAFRYEGLGRLRKLGVEVRVNTFKKVHATYGQIKLNGVEELLQHNRVLSICCHKGQLK